MKMYFKKVLLWAQRFTRLDMIYIARGGFWMSFGHVIGLIVSASVTIAAAYFLPKDTYGTYKYVLSLLGVLNIFTLAGIFPALTRAVARGKDDILKSTTFFLLRWSALFVVITNIAAAYYWLHDNHIIGGSLFIFAFTYPLIQSFNSYGPYLDGKRNFRLTSLLDSFNSIVASGSLIVAIILTNNVVILAATYAISNIVANGISYWITVKKYPESGAGTLDAETKSYGTSLSLISAFGAISQQFDKIFIFKYTGAVELAAYSIASAVPDRLKSYVKNITWLAFPKLSDKNADMIQSTMKKRLVQAFMFGSAAMLAYVILAPIAFKFLLPKYLDSIHYSQLLSLMTVFLVPTYYIGYAIQAQRFTRTIYLINVSSVVTRIGLLLLFGFLWGPLGVVWSRVVTIIILFFIHLILWNLEVHRPKADLTSYDPSF